MSSRRSSRQSVVKKSENLKIKLFNRNIAKKSREKKDDIGKENEDPVLVTDEANVRQDFVPSPSPGEDIDVLDDDVTDRYQYTNHYNVISSSDSEDGIRDSNIHEQQNHQDERSGSISRECAETSLEKQNNAERDQEVEGITTPSLRSSWRPSSSSHQELDIAVVGGVEDETHKYKEVMKLLEKADCSEYLQTFVGK